MNPFPSPLAHPRPMTRDEASLFLSGAKRWTFPGLLPSPEAHTNALFFSFPLCAPPPCFQPLTRAAPP